MEVSYISDRQTAQRDSEPSLDIKEYMEHIIGIFQKEI
jgi:hypothetical protein